MKVKRLKIKNIGAIADTTIDLNKPLLLFYGEIRQGKTTILNAIRWCFGGAFPEDIIRHGEKEASVELELDGGVIERSWYRAKSGKTESRPVTFIQGGRPVKTPVNELKRYLNPFLLDQDFLRKMGETERKKYFAEMFAVDTTDLDTEAVNLARDAQRLRLKIDAYGEIDLTPIPPTNLGELKQKLFEIRQNHSAQGQAVQAENRLASDQNRKRAEVEREIGFQEERIRELKKEIVEAEGKLTEAKQALKDLPLLVLKPLPESPDTSDLERQIDEATRNEVKRDALEKNQRLAEQKKRDAESLKTAEARQREIKAAKIARLKDISDKIAIKDLAFDEAGNFTYQGTDAGMLSTSQIMRLSSDLSALYPEGLGLELLDRGESLGKSIFDFIDRAKNEEKTILATIVGEAPAKVREDVGVFVVESGKVKPVEQEKLL